METELLDGGMVKRIKHSVGNDDTLVVDSTNEHLTQDENESKASEKVEMDIANILDMINTFTQMVSELLESGKSMMKELTDEFEERVFLIHKEQIEKWQDQVKELRLLDSENEEISACLNNARYLLQNVHHGA